MSARCRSTARRCSARCARRRSAGGSGRGVEFRRPSSPDEAVAALGDGAMALAGGTELVALMRDGIVAPSTLILLEGLVPKGLLYRSIQDQQPVATGTTITIGAGTTLGELEVDPEIPAALREACASAASPQLRAMSTLGGNLLQATRCWYWRLDYPCRLHGGDRCFAREGEHREHAIFANDFCASAHPSDLAAALLALGATVRTTSRELPVAELYRLPTEDDRRTTTLAPDELILELDVPAPEASAYLKAMDRKQWSFAIVGVAAARTGAETRLALAGVAPIPWLLDSLDQATPLPGNAFKVDVAKALVQDARAAVA
ncbi:MAG TPA: FAD binding domain-containing protein [Gaiellaceae bacterium]|nr:FAD binding domain-containing protein [Gaiellaceae bacterium]